MPEERRWTARVGGASVRGLTVGDGPPLVMLMGIGGSVDLWRPLVRHLPGRRLIMFDHPGTGHSSLSWLPPTMGWNAWWVQRLLRSLGLREVDLLGYSWGGLLAQHMAIQHRRMVRRLVIIASSVGLGGIPGSSRLGAGMVPPLRYPSRPQDRAVGPERFGSRAGRLVLLAGYAAQLSALAGYSTLPGLPFVSAPTLVVAGDDDSLVPMANARIMARHIPRSTLRIIPGAGHLLPLEQPETVGSLIDRFLSSPP